MMTDERWAQLRYTMYALSEAELDEVAAEVDRLRGENAALAAENKELAHGLLTQKSARKSAEARLADADSWIEDAVDELESIYHAILHGETDDLSDTDIAALLKRREPQTQTRLWSAAQGALDWFRQFGFNSHGVVMSDDLPDHEPVMKDLIAALEADRG